MPDITAAENGNEIVSVDILLYKQKCGIRFQTHERCINKQSVICLQTNSISYSHATLKSTFSHELDIDRLSRTASMFRIVQMEHCKTQTLKFLCDNDKTWTLTKQLLSGFKSDTEYN